MDPLRIQAYKTRVIKKRKGHQLLNDFILYSLTTLACTSFCSSPFWYPPFCATFNVFFFFSLPKITSFFFSSKALFIVGNLIVIFLLGESKFFTSKSKAYDDVCHGKYECNSLDQLQIVYPSQEQIKGNTITKDGLKQESGVKIFKTKACEQHDEDEFFESNDDEASCESDFNKENESSSHEEDGDNDEEVLSSPKQEVKTVDDEKHESLQGDVEGMSLATEELNKLVDDFIAKIIRQRKLEAEFCRG